MKQADIKIGEIYLTMVSGDLVQVRVVNQRTRTSYGRTERQKTVFVCVRVSTGQQLPKPRTAAALRAMPAMPPELTEA